MPIFHRKSDTLARCTILAIATAITLALASQRAWSWEWEPGSTSSPAMVHAADLFNPALDRIGSLSGDTEAAPSDSFQISDNWLKQHRHTLQLGADLREPLIAISDLVSNSLIALKLERERLFQYAQQQRADPENVDAVYDWLNYVVPEDHRVADQFVRLNQALKHMAEVRPRLDQIRSDRAISLSHAHDLLVNVETARLLLLSNADLPELSPLLSESMQRLRSAAIQVSATSAWTVPGWDVLGPTQRVQLAIRPALSSLVKGGPHQVHDHMQNSRTSQEPENNWQATLDARADLFAAVVNHSTTRTDLLARFAARNTVVRLKTRMPK